MAGDTAAHSTRRLVLLLLQTAMTDFRPVPNAVLFPVLAKAASRSGELVTS
ncbi:MAG: hypothetical protein M3Y55_05760 [Pseudomonadota bacterium]|nr:hypothetical protein [Pseudomonadota bacterium]